MNKPSTNLERNFLGLSGKPALVVVDMINGFTNSECPLGSYCPDVVQANSELLEALRFREKPIFLPRWCILMITWQVYSEKKCLR